MDIPYFESPVLWAHVDANRHLRHSAYADFGAQARIAMLEHIGLSMEQLEQHQIGPILFREELVYRREVKMNDKVKVSTVISKARADGSRWTMLHEIFRGDGKLAATITIDCAWLHLEQRKLTQLPDELAEAFWLMPRSADYTVE